VTIKYGKQIGIGALTFVVAIALVFGIKRYLLSTHNDVINSSVSHQNIDINKPNIATTEAIKRMDSSLTNVVTSGYDDLEEFVDVATSKYTYLVAPTFEE